MNPSAVFKWSKEYLIEILTSGREAILTDPLLVNAFQKVDRKHFVPREYSNRAYDDIEVPIGYNEKLNRVTLAAQMIAYLKPKFGGRYMDIGTGTGYSAAVIGFVAGDKGVVYSIERVQWIWDIARENLKKIPGINNVKLIYRDGIEGLKEQQPFDGIHISFSLNHVPEVLKMQLNKNGGRLVCPLTTNYIRIITRNGDNFTEEDIPGFFVDPGKGGLA